MLVNKVSLRRECLDLLPVKVSELAVILGVSRVNLVDDYKHDPELLQKLYDLWVALSILRYRKVAAADRVTKIRSQGINATLQELLK